MPLSINVGLSRKSSENYQSQGVSINVTAELDQSLLARPDELQQQIGDLYAQARYALDQQTEIPAQTEQSPARRRVQHPPRNNGGTASTGNGRASNGGNMTASQRRAIHAIANRVNVDPALEARDVIGEELDALSIRQASELIDHLKSQQPARNGGSGR